jgi:SNF family Na+-dependent transporter
MIGYEIGSDVVRDEVERSGVKMKIFGFFKLCVKFITPILMVLVLYGQIKEFFL